MAVPAHLADEYFTYESRLESFQTAQQLSKRRASNVSTKGAKSLKWPHKFLEPERLARAGLFYHPQQASPDNVACFLCHRSLDGWEKGDDPLAEHLTHSPDCGWAIVATIETQDGELSLEYPASARMFEARKATFGGKWPHEGKKGWKCKTKQLVDAGWKYTPTPEFDDMATCTYCNLALDGWEPSDKPLDEHHRRSPDCPFFALVNDHKQSPAGKKTRGKKDRSSKASRLSTQSTFTAASEAPSFGDLPTEEGDSILTTATNATAKNMGKGKKAAAKGRKTKKKAEPEPEPIEIVIEAAPVPTIAPEAEDDDFEPKVTVAPKATRGRKRKTEDTEHSSATMIEPAPAAKRRATRTRASVADDTSVLEESTVIQAPASKPGRRGRRSTRKASGVSVVSLKDAMPNDDEIDAALEADLAKQTNEELKPVVSKKSTQSGNITSDHDMFGIKPMEIDEANIDAELEAMEVDQKPLPKTRGAKSKQPRKVSAKQQAAAKKAAEATATAEQQVKEDEDPSQQITMELENSISMQHSSPVLQPKKQRVACRQPQGKKITRGSVMSANARSVSAFDREIETAHHENSGNETDASMASQSTVVRRGKGRAITKKGKVGNRNVSKNIQDIAKNPVSVPVDEEATIQATGGRDGLSEDVSMADEFFTPAPEARPVVQEAVPEVNCPKLSKSKGVRLQKIIPPPATQSPAIVIDHVVDEPKDPQSLPKSLKGKAIQVARSSTPPMGNRTPSQSPQSSDAENHPPSSKAPATARKAITPHSSTTRIPLAASTPTMSPSKRNVIAGLQSTHPWNAVDIDHVFLQTPNDENSPSKLFVAEAMDKVKKGGLTSPEKQMTVEEWILHNAELAEEKLRTECEGMVGKFESQGTRAMIALEGIQCVE